MTGELLSLRPGMVEEEGVLEKEKNMVSMAKKIGLISAGAAAGGAQPGSIRASRARTRRIAESRLNIVPPL